MNVLTVKTFLANVLVSLGIAKERQLKTVKTVEIMWWWER